MDCHSTILGNRTGERWNAHLQTTGGFRHPLACQSAIQQVAETGGEIRRENRNEPALAVRIAVQQWLASERSASLTAGDFAFYWGYEFRLLSIAHAALRISGLAGSTGPA